MKSSRDDQIHDEAKPLLLHDSAKAKPFLSQDAAYSKPSLSQEAAKDRPKVSVLRARITSAFIPIFLMSSNGGREILLPQLLVQRLGEGVGRNNETKPSVCGQEGNNSLTQTTDSLQAQASEDLMYFSLATCLPAFLTCLLLASYSDYMGRRWMVLVPVFTCFFKTFLLCCVVRWNLNLVWYYLGCVTDGLAGSWYFMLVALYSFTADISHSKQARTFWIYFVSCTSAIMGAAVNMTVGYLVKLYGFFEALLFLSSLMLLAFVVPLLFLPETLQSRRSIRGVSPLTHARKICGFYFVYGSRRQRATYCVCLLLFVMAVVNDLNVAHLDSLYQMTCPFCWDSVQIGDYSAIRTAGGHLCAMCLFKLVQKCLPIETIAMVGCVFHSGAFLFEGFITESWQFYLVPVIQIPSCPVVSIIRTMFSILAGPENQGAVFSSIAIVETLCSLVSSQIYNRIYSATVSSMPGAVYLVMAGVSVITFSLFGVYFLVRETVKQEKEVQVRAVQEGIE